jgi:preprotein translocase subunit SecD
VRLALTALALVACGKPAGKQAPAAPVKHVDRHYEVSGSGDVEHAATVMRARVAAEQLPGVIVAVDGKQLVITMVEGDVDTQGRLEGLTRNGDLTFQVVDDGTDVFAKVGSGSDVHPEPVIWKADDGTAHHDVQLVARNHDHVGGRTTLEKFLADNQIRPPAGDDFGFEPVVPDDPNREPIRWRAYVLVAKPELTSSAVGHATHGFNTSLNRPDIRLELTPSGATAFGELTARIVGKKLAIVIDGTIRSAPIIAEPITSGHVEITLGGFDAAQQELEARDLGYALDSGALGVTLTLASITRVD